MSEDQFEWELSRENIQPLRSGRRVQSINSALHTAKSKETIDQHFQEVMSCMESTEDPLALCIEFIAWFDQHYTIGHHKMLYNYLWKMISKIIAREEYVDDERVLRVWSRMAANSLGNGFNVYQHAFSIGSLRRCARFYIEWSRCGEEIGDYEECRRIIIRGKRAGAAPISVLNEYEDDLEMRILRSTQIGMFDDEDEDLNGESRAALARLHMDIENATPVVRLPSVSGSGASNRLPTNPPKLPQAAFEIHTDERDNWLEDIYHLHTHIERIEMVENSYKDAHNHLMKATLQPIPSFKIYDENAQKKMKLMLLPELIKNISMEEHRLAMMEQTPLEG